MVKQIQIALILILFLLSANSAYTFRSKLNYDINVDTSLSIGGMTASAWGTTLASNDVVCRGPITLTSGVSGTYSVGSGQVRCPSGVCNRYATSEMGASPQPQISWSSATDFDTTISAYCSGPLPGYGGCTRNTPYCGVYCQTSGAAGTNSLASYVIHVNYYTLVGGKLEPPNPANNGIFCRGRVQAISNGVPIVESTAQTTSSTVYTPPTNNTYSLNNRLLVDNCAMMTRSFEKPYTWFSNTISPVYDALYFYTGGAFTYSGDSPSISNLNVINGPLLSATPLRIDPTIPGGTTAFSFTITNNGDRDASITSLTFTDNLGNPWPVTLVTPSPATPFTVAADGVPVSVTGTTTAPAGLADGTYNVTASMAWTAISATPIIGPCGSSAGAGALLAVTSPGVVVASDLSSYFNQLDLKVVVDPTGIIQDRNHWITVNVSASRGGQEIYLDDINITISRWSNESDPPSWEYAAGWNPSNQNICDFNSWGDNIYLQYSNGDYTYGFASDRYRVHYLSPNTCTSIGNDWLTGVYRVTVSTSDSSIIPNRQNYNISKYFVIYDLPCSDR